jgi:RNA polymerase sigma factor (sigma-70 family)
MVRNSAIPPESFDEILAWLNADREVAATIYLQLRDDLTKIFMWNRCSDPEGLTDEAFDRVARKVHELRQTFEGDPRLFFYGVARNLIRENAKKIRAQVSLENTDLPANRVSETEVDTANLLEECLQTCLQKLTSEKRELIVNYYSKEKQAKIRDRTEMAERLGTSLETLRVRVYRIRATLEQCIERCLDRRGKQ